MFIKDGGNTMLYINFVQGDHEDLPKHERIPFNEAVALSHRIEAEMREKKSTIPSYFYVIDDEMVDTLYEGEFVFGSHSSPNLYIHIINKLQSIKTSKENEKLRLSFITDMEAQVDEEYKKQDDSEDNPFQNLDRSRISRLKSWQRRSIYGLAGALGLACIGIFSFFLLQIASISEETETSVAQAEEQEEAIEYYEQALLGEEGNLETFLSDKDIDSLSDRERNVYASLIADNQDFETLNTLFEEDNQLVATFLGQRGNIPALRAYNEQYPTNEGRFDIAFAEENYEELLHVENVEMNSRRSEMRTKALLETGDIEGARSELENNTSTELAERVNRYGELNSEISDLNEQIENLDKEEDEEEIETLEEQKERLENERSSI